MMRFTPLRGLPRGTTTTTTAIRITTPSHHLPRISRPYSTPPPQHERALLTLAIETSCDDTCVAVLEKSGPSARLLFNKKVTSDHRAFGGVHPAVAVIGHDAALATLVQEAIQHLPEAPSPSPSPSPTNTIVRTPTPRRAPDFVAATRGPGMSANLSVGLNTAKGLACAWGVPLLGIHHMQAHLLTPRLVSALSLPFPSPPSPSPPSYTPTFPFLTLLISGGHTLLLHSRSLTSHRLLATTSSHAIGNMLDATARLILPPSSTTSSPNVMYAAALESFAFPPGSTPSDYDYTPPLRRADEILPYHSPPPPGSGT
ncbi:glycoprotease family-domain-containing protein [Schizothecium vesticola]|uniref:N(6)-L-threonylcarbamoyladenine synthase n=1 Tax=Schizothecium vesticola TaxID=314040 RepID=A0AA40F9Z9_9PEZI|nr:glycoprotease family-domain-containing protein [Schizothecium vesticola]